MPAKLRIKNGKSYFGRVKLLGKGVKNELLTKKEETELNGQPPSFNDGC